MRNITIVGAGQSGLQLGLGLLQNGYRVRMITNRTPEDIATGKVMSSQFMFNDSLQAERDLGINFWEKECPNTDALGVTIAAPDGGKAVSWVYTLDKPGQAVDQRVKFPGWMKKFAERGGELVIHEAGVADLENYARSSDLVILAGGKGDIVKLFERDAERSPFDKPQRARFDLRHRAYSLRADPRRLQHRADRRRIFRLPVAHHDRTVRDHGARRHSRRPHGLLGRRENAGAAPRTQPRYPEEILLGNTSARATPS